MTHSSTLDKPATWLKIAPKIALTLVIFTSYAQANASTGSPRDPVVSEFKTAATVLPSRLKAAGYDSIGDVQIKSFIDEFSKNVQVHSVQKIQHNAGDVDGLRDSARWHREGGKASIAINRSFWHGTKATIKPVLAMHEALGALGFEDHICTCSGAIWMLTDRGAQKALNSEQRTELEQLAQSTCRFAGGSSTGVTGGGDEYAITIKLGVIEKNLKELSTANNQQVKDEAIDEALGELTSTDFFVVRGNLADNAAVAKPQGFTMVLDRIPQDPERITVMMDDKKVPQSAIDGWTFDASKNTIFFHGKYDNYDHTSVSAQF